MADQGGVPEDDAPDAKPDLKFVGGRFDGQGFPLDGIQELAKYQRLVLEVAKQVWVEQNPGKKIPDNLIDQVRLRLIDIQPGSQKTYFLPPVEQAFPGILTLRELTEDRIHTTFNEIIKANYGSLAEADPGVVTAYRVIGSSLTGDEMLAIRPERADEVRYGRTEHDLLLAGLRGLRFERTGTLVGVLDDLGSANKFTLIDAEGRSIPGKFSDPDVWVAFHTLHNQKAQADLIWLDCDYVISEKDSTVLRISEVREANLFGKSSNPMAVRLAGFAALPEGHADGEGERTEVFAIQAALEVLDGIVEYGWAEPALFPSLEGGVRMEWLTEHSHTVLTVDNDAHFDAFHLNVDTGEEAFDEPAGVNAALEFVGRFIA